MTLVDTSRELAWIRSRLAEPLTVGPEVAVIATNLKGSVAYWSTGAERLYGWREQEAFRRDILDLTPADYALNQSVEIMSALQAGQVWSGEILLGRRDSSPVLAFVLDIPVGDFSREQGAIVGISVDASHRDSLEQAVPTLTAAVIQRFI